MPATLDRHRVVVLSHQITCTFRYRQNKPTDARGIRDRLVRGLLPRGSSVLLKSSARQRRRLRCEAQFPRPQGLGSRSAVLEDVRPDDIGRRAIQPRVVGVVDGVGDGEARATPNESITRFPRTQRFLPSSTVPSHLPIPG